MVFPIAFLEAWLILIQNNMYCWWIDTKKSREYKLYNNIGEFQQWNEEGHFGYMYWNCSINNWSGCFSLHKKWSFALRISSVNVPKSARNCGFGHIYWRNPYCKTSFFVQCVHYRLRCSYFTSLLAYCSNIKLALHRS